MKYISCSLVIMTVSLMSIPSMAQETYTNWVGKFYQIEGQWSIVDDTVHLHDDFGTADGPDLKVYLVQKAMAEIGKRESVDIGGVYLGELKSSSGQQSYAILEGTDVTNYRTFFIHCREYSVVWGGADLPK